MKQSNNNKTFPNEDLNNGKQSEEKWKGLLLEFEQSKRIINGISSSWQRKTLMTMIKYKE